jgi:hypothetical protein
VDLLCRAAQGLACRLEYFISRSCGLAVQGRGYVWHRYRKILTHVVGNRLRRVGRVWHGH